MLYRCKHTTKTTKRLKTPLKRFKTAYIHESKRETVFHRGNGNKKRPVSGALCYLLIFKSSDIITNGKTIIIVNSVMRLHLPYIFYMWENVLFLLLFLVLLFLSLFLFPPLYSMPCTIRRHLRQSPTGAITILKPLCYISISANCFNSAVIPLGVFANLFNHSEK